MYIPHGNYPENIKGFNCVENLPELFTDIEFRDFALTLSERELFWDFSNSEMFLYSSNYQENYGAKLVMLLSAVERISGKWEPIENILKSTSFKNGMLSCPDGEESYKFMLSEIEKYNSDFGSFRRIVNFYKNNLSKNEKELIVNGIKQISSFKKHNTANYGIVFKSEPLATENSKIDIDIELSIRLKKVIYYLRNCFAHKAEYIPYPDKEFIKNKPLYSFIRYEKQEPKDEWAIFLKFESLHEITRKAFINYWIKIYRDLSKGKDAK